MTSPDRSSPWPLVVMFHGAYRRIERADVFQAWNATTGQIARLLADLSRDLDFVDEAYLIEHAGSPEAFRGKALVTFDDGYASVHAELRDVVRERGIRPLLFLVSDALTRGSRLWYQRLALAFRRSSRARVEYDGQAFVLAHGPSRLKLYRRMQRDLLATRGRQAFDERLAALEARLDPAEGPPLDTDMAFLRVEDVRDLLADGWSVGSHGRTHTPLDCLETEDAEREIRESQAALRQLFGVPVRSLSYPNGTSTPEVAQVAAQLYDLTFLAAPDGKADDPRQVPRFDFPADELAIRNQARRTASTAPSRSGRRARVVVLCGPNPPERHAVRHIAARFDLAGLVVSDGRPLPTPFGAPLLDHENASAASLLDPAALTFSPPAGCAVLVTRDVGHPAVEELVLRLAPDALVVFGTGVVRSERLLGLAVPKLNLHWGKAPRYRGSSTLRWPVVLQDRDGLAVTVHEITSHIDGGPVFAQAPLVLDGSETLRDIEYLASRLGTELLLDLLQEIERGETLIGRPQDLAAGRFYRVADWHPELDRLAERILLEGFPARGSAEGTEVEVIRRSVFFDETWYRASGPTGDDPAAHYLTHGPAEGRDPGPAFSSARYLAEHPDVARAGVNPLLHFERWGRDEGRLPRPPLT